VEASDSALICSSISSLVEFVFVPEFISVDSIRFFSEIAADCDEVFVTGTGFGAIFDAEVLGAELVQK
jgi:hypothetical protein